MNLPFLPLFISFRFMYKVNETQLEQQEYILSDHSVAVDLLQIFDRETLFFSEEVLKLFAFFNVIRSTPPLLIDNFLRLNPIAKLFNINLRYRIYQTQLVNPRSIPESQKLIAHVMVLIVSPPVTTQQQ